MKISILTVLLFACAVPELDVAQHSSEVPGHDAGHEHNGQGVGHYDHGNGNGYGHDKDEPDAAPAIEPSLTCAGLCSTGYVPGSEPDCYCDASCVGFGDCCGGGDSYLVECPHPVCP